MGTARSVHFALRLQILAYLCTQCVVYYNDESLKHLSRRQVTEAESTEQIFCKNPKRLAREVLVPAASRTTWHRRETKGSVVPPACFLAHVFSVASVVCYNRLCTESSRHSAWHRRRRCTFCNKFIGITIVPSADVRGPWFDGVSLVCQNMGTLLHALGEQFGQCSSTATQIFNLRYCTTARRYHAHLDEIGQVWGLNPESCYGSSIENRSTLFCFVHSLFASSLQ